MMSSGFLIGFVVIWALHVFSVIAFFTGLLFLIVLAIKTFSHAQLKAWAIWLMIIGTVICLLTIGARGAPWTSGGMMKHGGMMRMSMMGKMMNGMMGRGGMMDMDDMMDMSMDDMAAALEGKSGDDFDKAFIEMMIPHHQGAIDMAELAQENAKHAEIKTLATQIMAAQKREIDRMEQWQKSWGYEE